MPEGEWLTYAQLGERWGISPAAVRQKAIRARWPRRPANDGKTLVRPALEDVRVPSPRKPKDAPSTNARPTAVERPSDTRTIAALERHIETLKAAAAATEARVEQERTRADRLQEELLELAKSRADLTGKLVQAEREAACAPVLRETVTTLRAALDSERQHKAELRQELDLARRPWWRRLMRAA
jgi:predicted RNase H-like nuclease (RuvC/YqgF family)